ncbi:uncharacterized protein LOC131635097 isoform X2 [Vicia villosa]|uniref:uncharacterized protein LOC131635097 isoform X2 n=1 Tax=Vicia villosa TaxID=3911 RepID=UPI00273AB013|nr:uncharacterized protein LOC131635097 isoform X2 [Vicia villosa]XP_058761681.1 uncharacterized protein LOC131635097 isoform X2 [Vicia villosa]XP_058761683.1 uncharacterized protein LOC131635097 isoform X2 [Vicia villosa]XP_058761684.1 uncharacterized protein LOC131635097 isoform X2 [Vicia villosa]XP_058761685.1 uncharacterized protein LOC131635097 isoform X2 [Vicia villosa]XP_058761686.1 uncharacterized protein LOC131635097 isoform X2 [Vicia villosa]XP_058761687.1 uncharacterized protein LO
MPFLLKISTNLFNKVFTLHVKHIQAAILLANLSFIIVGKATETEEFFDAVNFISSMQVYVWNLMEKLSVSLSKSGNHNALEVDAMDKIPCVS